MSEEERKAGDYTIIQSMSIGDREIVIGENPESPDGNKYMCAFCTANGLFERYEEVLVGDDYPEIVEIYGQRIAEQAKKTRTELNAMKISDAALTEKDCKPVSYDDDLKNKVVVIRQEVLRREYRKAFNQIKLCTGGFGAAPNSRGSACYCVDLYSGKEARFERRDILGILEPEKLPEWAKQGLLDHKQKYSQKQKNEKEVR